MGPSGTLGKGCLEGGNGGGVEVDSQHVESTTREDAEEKTGRDTETRTSDPLFSEVER